MTPDPSLMSIEGLHDAAFGSAFAMCDAPSVEQRRRERKFLLAYLAELKRRALRAEHDLTMQRLSQRPVADAS